jgi:hypothetical protein
MKIRLDAYQRKTPMLRNPLLHKVLLDAGKTLAYFASSVISQHGR